MLDKQGIADHLYNPRTQEVEEEESGVQGHSWLRGESEAFATLDFVFKTTALEFVVNVLMFMPSQ